MYTIFDYLDDEQIEKLEKDLKNHQFTLPPVHSFERYDYLKLFETPRNPIKRLKNRIKLRNKMRQINKMRRNK